jgi:phosphatidate cytidylyltransferase
MKLNNLLTRTITGLLYAAVILAGLCLNATVFFIVFAVAAALTIWEFYGLMENYMGERLNKVRDTIGGLLLFAGAFLTASGLAGAYSFVLYLLYAILVFVEELYNRSASDPIRRWSIVFLGQTWCAAPFALMNYLAFAEGGAFEPYSLLAVIVFVWLSDSGAYIFGSLFGRRRLLERISPKKSWEGFFGGLALAVAASLVFARYIDSLHTYQWITLAVITVVFGTCGDLCESLLKRRLGVKDSGNILPGHGGMMDRFDSILMAVPASLLLLLN